MSRTVGWTRALLSVAFFPVGPWYMTQPLPLGLTDNVADTNDGIFHVDSVADGFRPVRLVIPGFLLRWYGSPALRRRAAVRR